MHLNGCLLPLASRCRPVRAPCVAHSLHPASVSRLLGFLFFIHIQRWQSEVSFRDELDAAACGSKSACMRSARVLGGCNGWNILFCRAEPHAVHVLRKDCLHGVRTEMEWLRHVAADIRTALLPPVCPRMSLLGCLAGGLAGWRMQTGFIELEIFFRASQQARKEA